MHGNRQKVAALCLVLFRTHPDQTLPEQLVAPLGVIACDDGKIQLASFDLRYQ
jgi:hypothetical protein